MGKGPTNLVDRIPTDSVIPEYSIPAKTPKYGDDPWQGKRLILSSKQKLAIYSPELIADAYLTFEKTCAYEKITGRHKMLTMAKLCAYLGVNKTFLDNWRKESKDQEELISIIETRMLAHNQNCGESGDIPPQYLKQYLTTIEGWVDVSKVEHSIAPVNRVIGPMEVLDE